VHPLDESPAPGPAGLEPLPGGWSGRTFVADSGGERTVVRIFPPEEWAEAPEIQGALHHLVRGLVPVPEVREVRRPDAAAGTPGLLVTGWVPGERADLVVPELDERGLGILGGHLGRLLATLGGMPFARAGLFASAALDVTPFSSGGLAEWVDSHADALLGHGWTSSEVTALLAVADPAQDLLDEADRVCLAHSDLNPKNLLVDPQSLEVTGLVDWEFAHAGHPATDLGNLLRFERQPAFSDAVLTAYAEVRGGDPERLLATARAADLWALVDLAARAGDNPVATRASALLHEVAAGWTDPPAPA